jgi:hypothetical protein
MTERKYNSNNDLALLCSKIMIAELLCLSPLLLWQPGDIEMSLFYFYIWPLSIAVNLLFIILLLMYRPKFYLWLLLAFVALPFLPMIFFIFDSWYLLDLLINGLKKTA